jgi:hypothetical protein
MLERSEDADGEGRWAAPLHELEHCVKVERGIACDLRRKLLLETDGEQLAATPRDDCRSGSFRSLLDAHIHLVRVRDALLPR